MRRAIVCLMTLFVLISSVCTQIYAATTRINNLIVIMKENRSFDHYVGFLRQIAPYNCLDGNPDHCVDGLLLTNPGPIEWNPTDATRSNCILSNKSGRAEILHETRLCTLSPPHSWDAMHTYHDKGLNDDERQLEMRLDDN